VSFIPHLKSQVVRDVSTGLVNHSRWLTLHDRTWYDMILIDI
jgi:hypothetical protein